MTFERCPWSRSRVAKSLASKGWEHALDDLRFLGRVGLAAHRRIGAGEKRMQEGVVVIALNGAAEGRNRVVSLACDEIGDAEIDILGHP